MLVAWFRRRLCGRYALGRLHDGHLLGGPGNLFRRDSDGLVHRRPRLHGVLLVVSVVGQRLDARRWLLRMGSSSEFQDGLEREIEIAGQRQNDRPTLLFDLYCPFERLFLLFPLLIVGLALHLQLAKGGQQGCETAPLRQGDVLDEADLHLGPGELVPRVHEGGDGNVLGPLAVHLAIEFLDDEPRPLHVERFGHHWVVDVS
mmetsp:Transcript_32421/g.80280  ORF Transcript_32421/g.80280 Transcript_32421/m.80280 type:complete len:202 (+) Transcript_32421:899-1504(+)